VKLFYFIGFQGTVVIIGPETMVANVSAQLLKCCGIAGGIKVWCKCYSLYFAIRKLIR